MDFWSALENVSLAFLFSTIPPSHILTMDDLSVGGKQDFAAVNAVSSQDT